jgi:glycosyltransferase involved in cell wall biosynthesis
MRIVAVGDTPFPFGSAGASRMRNILRGLKELDHDVHFISFTGISHRSNDIVNNDRYFKGIRYESILGYDNGSKKGYSLWMKPFWYMQIMKSTWRGYQRVKLIFEESKIDAVIVYSRNAFSFEPVINLAKTFGIPVISDVVEWPSVHSFRGGIINPLFLNTLRMLNIANCKVNGITAISSFIEEKYHEKGLPVLRVPALVEPDLFLKSSISINDLSNDSNIFNLFYLGSLSKKDDPASLLTVIKSLALSGKSINLHVVGTNGKTGNAHRFSKACKRENISNLVRFHGWVSDWELKKILLTADAFILPRIQKLDEQAAFPTRLPELMLTGKPVVTVRVGDIEEYLLDGVHAFVCDPGDANDLCNRIRELIDNPSLGKKIGYSGMRRAIDAFSYQQHGSRIEKFINKMS